MIREQDVAVFQGRGDEQSALGPSISHPVIFIFGSFSLLARFRPGWGVCTMLGSTFVAAALLHKLSALIENWFKGVHR